MFDENKVAWPGWEVVRKIGNGSFGAVYEIQRNTFGNIEKAALKVISIPQSQSDIEELYNDGYDDASITARYNGYLEDILREYAMMVNMKGHTNVVYCDDYRYEQNPGGIGWDIYIKMELLTPLTKALGRQITEQETVKLGMDIANALVLCKERSIVHRDIKPQNIFVSQDGSYKLGDFGIAKTAERTTSGTKVGTYKYMAPEVYNNQPYGTGADIYSLGLVMYWMLNERRTPFLPLPPEVPTTGMEDNARHRRFSGEPIPAPAHGSQELKRIVLKACAFDPRERYASAALLLADLKKVAAGLPPEPAEGIPVIPAAPAEPAAPAPEAEAVDGTVNIFRNTDSGSFRLGTDAFEEKTEYIHRDASEEKTEYIREEKTVYIPRQTAVQVEEPEKKKKKKGILPLILAIIAVIVVILLLLKSCGGEGKPSGTEDQQPSTGEQASTDGQESTGEQAGGDETEDSGVLTLEVPDVTGKDRDAAKQILEEAGFEVAFTEEYSSGDSGKVIRQEPEAGTELEPGACVTVCVSKGVQQVAVTMDPCGGKVDQTELTVGVAGEYGELPVPARDGYTFVGWFTAKEGGDEILATSTVERDSDHTLYARWSTEAYQVTFDGNGGSVDPDSKTVEFNNAYGTLPTPTKKGYTFQGWYTAKDGGEKVTEDTKMTKAAKHTLYARWKVNSYKVSFDANDGTVSPSSASVTYGSTYSSLPVPTRTGYTFQGWYTAPSGGTKVTTSTEMTATKDHTLYALWKVNSYKVSWNTGTGYSITVKRTDSPNGGASTGTLSSGDAVYYGDKLTVTYTASTGYSISSKGSTSITVTGNVTSSDIYATAAANSYTYNIVYKSSNGTSLGTGTVTYKYGTTNTVGPKSISGYTAPAVQTVVWDSTSAKTITFVYTPVAVSATTKSGNIYNETYSYLAYSAKIEYRNRTANSVQIRVTWTATLSGKSGGKAYNQFAQWFRASVGSVSTGNVKVISQGTWSSSSASARSGTASSGWITVPLNTTNATSLNLSVYYYQANYNGTDMSSSGYANMSATWSVAIPAY